MIRTWHSQLYTLFWSLLLKARAPKLRGLICFIKYQTCWWPGRSVCMCVCILQA